MALDQAFFDGIHIDLVKRKYYNANKVEALLDEIRRQARALTAENEALRAKMSEFSGRKEEIGDTLLSAKTIARQILQEAQAQADEILAAAESRARELEAEAEERSRESRELGLSAQQESVRRMEASYSRLRERLLSCVDSLNADWQDYLCSLDGEEESAPPVDLEEKIGRIAEAMLALDEDGSVETTGIEA